MKYVSTDVKLRTIGYKLTEESAVTARLSINTAYKYTKVSSLHESYLTEMVHKFIQDATYLLLD